MEAGASVIAFVQAASAIVKCIVKAKQLWDHLKDIPRELSELIEDVEAFEACFRDIEAQFKDPRIPTSAWDDTTAQRSLHHCKRALKILEDLVNDLSTQIEARKGFKKKVVLVKAHMKQELLTRYQKRLERCIQYLNMSAYSYQTSLIKQIPELVVTRVSSDILPKLMLSQSVERHNVHLNSKTQIEPPEHQIKALVRSKTASVSTKAHAPSRWGRFAMAYANDTGAWQACVQWPSWVSRSVYELHSARTFSGWTYNYRVYNVVSYESEVMVKVRNGDKQGVLDLFSARKASPLDRDDEGRSLLYVSFMIVREEDCWLKNDSMRRRGNIMIFAIFS